MPTDFRVKVRMYRQGLGDCFLITLPRSDGSNYFILIDCGVIVGTPDAVTKLTAVVSDIVSVTGGKLDLVLATHEHWDHISGFIQAEAQFKQLTVGQVWLGWTEDPNDELAKQLATERSTAAAGLRLAADRLQLGGDAEGAALIQSLLELSGASAGSGGTTHDAMGRVRGLASTVRYCRPDDAPVDLNDPKVRLYTLGPPRDERLLKKTSPSAGSDQTYGNALAALENDLQPALGETAPDAPFGSLYTIPLSVAQGEHFFTSNYWGPDDWRRIDTAWLADSSAIALQLDNATNNTCLVLAIELENGDVLLFPGDAQVGNWLSWQSLTWSIGGRSVTGPDLLKRAIMYKVGHHGSFNATLRQNGLETMSNLQIAMVPVNQDTAKKKGWANMPLPALLAALADKAHSGVLRVDSAAPSGMAELVGSTPLYYEIAL